MLDNIRDAYTTYTTIEESVASSSPPLINDKLSSLVYKVVAGMLLFFTLLMLIGYITILFFAVIFCFSAAFVLFVYDLTLEGPQRLLLPTTNMGFGSSSYGSYTTVSSTDEESLLANKYRAQI